MTQVFLSLGSNIDAEKNIQLTVDALRQDFEDACFSPIYESEAVGFDGDNFLNLVASVEVKDALYDLNRKLKYLEFDLGRVKGGEKFSSRVVDIDILLYGDLAGFHDGIQLPREEIYENAYVLLPLQDLYPDALDPNTGLSFSELWEKHKSDMVSQKLWPSDFQVNMIA